LSQNDATHRQRAAKRRPAADLSWLSMRMIGAVGTRKRIGGTVLGLGKD